MDFTSAISHANICILSFLDHPSLHNYCSCKKFSKSCCAFQAMASSMDSNDCCLDVSGNASWCFTGCTMRCISSHGRSTLLVQLSTIFCWTRGKLCNAPLRFFHMYHAMFQSFLMSRTPLPAGFLKFVQEPHLALLNIPGSSIPTFQNAIPPNVTLVIPLLCHEIGPCTQV